MSVDVIMPKLGESITEGTILEWKKNIGDSISKDETLLEISTDKVDSEVPSPAEGKVIEILYKINDVVAVGCVVNVCVYVMDVVVVHDCDAVVCGVVVLWWWVWGMHACVCVTTCVCARVREHVTHSAPC